MTMNRRNSIIVSVIAAALLVFAAGSLRHAPWTGSVARAVAERGPLSETERANRDLRESLALGRAGRGAIYHQSSQ
jgi:hypothetical protein